MLLSAVSVLVVAQSSSEIPERLMNNPVYFSISAVFEAVLFGVGTSVHNFMSNFVYWKFPNVLEDLREMEEYLSFKIKN